MEYRNLTLDIADQVATITLDRPNAANAIDLALARELSQAAVECDESNDVRAVLLTAKGKLFSAGGDVRSFANSGENVSRLIKAMTTHLHAAISRLARMEAPVVVAVNGGAAGAGMSLALMGDFVLAAESAQFTMAYTRIGFSPDGSSTYFLPRLIGVRRTMDLMITNRALSATEAEQWGLVSRVVPDAQLATEARDLALKLADGPTRAYGCVKRLLQESFGNGLETQMELETRAIADMSTTADGIEGIAAFIEKRKPEFHGL